MTDNVQDLIDGYLDETISSDECAALNRWLKESPENAQRFAQAVLLHDRLRGEHLALAAMVPQSCPPPTTTAARPARRNVRSFAAMAGVAVTAAVLLAVLWKELGERPVSAAVVEINRIMAANAQPADRTYQLTVEETALPEHRHERPEPSDRGRPPKPPIDGAVLHVRGGRQFVLVRKTKRGLPFVTGSNGQTSWAVRPDGPVRVSTDLTRFSHDLPGHEHSMPLISIHDGLERLLEAYDVQLLPVESQDDGSNADDELSRLIVGVKKKGYRGPRRVEITYSVRSGLIRQMRFVEMPYGPERLTLRMTLIEERSLGEIFFDHQSHHAPERTVEFEE